jgi:hypothetical protein
MKTYRHLYPQIIEWDNLYWAYAKARKGKRKRSSVAAFEYDQETQLVQLQLLSVSHRTGLSTKIVMPRSAEASLRPQHTSKFLSSRLT